MLVDFRVARFTAVALLGGILLSAVATAQDGVSTAGASRTRYLGNLGVIPSPKDVVVEDFVNFHRHEIGRPKANEAVGLDVRWGNDRVSKGQEAVLQVGLSTALVHDRAKLRPLNVSLVIDKSGSMESANKLTRVKDAMKTFISQLRPIDTISIVTFDDEAEVLMPATKVDNPHHIVEIIESINTGSSTNLEAGMKLGYEQAAKTYQKDATNRVILLTDGIANRGMTAPRDIAQESQGYNDRGIDISTIGVGEDINRDLLQTLARSGRGLYHFVGDNDDVKKVFVDEMQSLVSPVATEPNVEVFYENGLEMTKLYGYDSRSLGSHITVKLPNLNSGATEVILLKFKPHTNEASIPVKVKLTYFDLESKKTITTTQTTTLNVSGSNEADALKDDSVAKNYTIAELAQSVHDMASACEEKQYGRAQSLLTRSLTNAKSRYPRLDDPDISRTFEIASKYQRMLERYNEDNPVKDEPIKVTNSENLIFNGDFSLGNQGFTVPVLNYSPPVDNCLWSNGYTVAASFNSPHLHHLVKAQDFAAPNRKSGNEMAFYANAGGTDTMIILQCNVECKPNTTYQLKFDTISLTAGVEWIPTYEIRVNGERSEAQAAGELAYKEVKFNWNSKNSRRATISIVRMPIPHGGGIIGIANLKMVPVTVL